MGAFFKPSEKPGVKRAKRNEATLIPGFSDGTLCAAIAEQMNGVAHSPALKNAFILTAPCGWVHFQLPKWVKSTLALTVNGKVVREHRNEMFDRTKMDNWAKLLEEVTEIPSPADPSDA